MKIVRELIAEKLGKVIVVESYIESLPSSLKSDSLVELIIFENALAWSDTIVLLVNHKVFYNIDRKTIERKVAIETRGILR